VKRSRFLLAGLLAIVVGVFGSLTPAGAATAPTSKVWVTHGLPLDANGTKVDVYVDGSKVLSNFAFGDTAGPLTLPAATYDIQIKLAGTDTTAIEQKVAVPGGGNFSVVASYVDAAGKLGLNVFANDLSQTFPFTGRLALHHAAAAPAVDVDLGLYPLSRWFPALKATAVRGAENGAQAALVVPSFLRYTADVRLAGTATNVPSLDNVKVTARTLTNVYVVGNPATGTLQTISSTIRL